MVICVHFSLLNTGLSDTGKLSVAQISFDARTEARSPRYVFRLGNVAFLRILTSKTIVNANAVLFTLPEGYRPKRQLAVKTQFIRTRDGAIGVYDVIMNTNGTMVSNFNDDGEAWNIDLFYVYTVG